MVVFFVLLTTLFAYKRYVPPDYAVLAEKIQKEKAGIFSNRYNMILVAEGGDMMDTVNVFRLHFELKGPLSKDKLRKILVDCVEELLEGINSEPRLKGHLKMEPFTEEGVDIALFVVDAKGEEVAHPEISVAAARRSTIKYKTADLANPNVYKSETEESYEQAKRLVGR